MRNRIGPVNYLGALLLALTMLAASPQRADACEQWEKPGPAGCVSICPNGQLWTDFPGLATTCTVCSQGLHTDSATNKCVPCASGKSNPDGTCIIGEAAAFPCKEGQFRIQQKDGSTACGVCTEDDYYISTQIPGQPAVFQCASCPPGSKSAGGGKHYCYTLAPDLCQPGFYNWWGPPAAGSVLAIWHCSICPAGEYSKTVLFWNPWGGQKLSACYGCDPGMTSKAGQTTCCPPGANYVVSKDGIGACTKTKKHVPLKCRLGTVANADRTACIPAAERDQGKQGLNCPPNMRPNASRTGCLPNLDTGDFGSPGSTIRTPGGPSGGGATAPGGRGR